MKNQAVQITPKGLQWFKRGHPWIYRSDLHGPLPQEAGVVEVVDLGAKFLAKAFYSPLSKIALRILSRKKEAIDGDWWRKKILKTLARKKTMDIPSTARRLIYAEGDGLPSLIVDQYGPYLCVQTLSSGLEIFKEMIFDLLAAATKCKGILERNESAVRKKEGLEPIKKVAMGEVPTDVEIEEVGLKFVVDLWHGQKTGAFLDQRSNRILAGKKARGKILDVFSYNGWFACHMAQCGGTVLCIESSKSASERLLHNAQRNGLQDKIAVEVRDAFEFLKEADRAGLHFDTVNLDPPGFIKNTCERLQGFRGYKEINLRAMKFLKPRGLLISSSCSYHFSPKDFSRMLDAAATDAGVAFAETCIGRISPDHPIHPHFPEGNYLKCHFVAIKSS